MNPKNRSQKEYLNEQRVKRTENIFHTTTIVLDGAIEKGDVVPPPQYWNSIYSSQFILKKADIDRDGELYHWKLRSGHLAL
jgi:hypothetical protein